MVKIYIVGQWGSSSTAVSEFLLSCHQNLHYQNGSDTSQLFQLLFPYVSVVPVYFMGFSGLPPSWCSLALRHVIRSYDADCNLHIFSLIITDKSRAGNAGSFQAFQAPSRLVCERYQLSNEQVLPDGGENENEQGDEKLGLSREHLSAWICHRRILWKGRYASHCS